MHQGHDIDIIAFQVWHDRPSSEREGVATWKAAAHAHGIVQSHIVLLKLIALQAAQLNKL